MRRSTNFSISMAIGLLATLFTVPSPLVANASAPIPISASTYYDGTCNLGDGVPGNHTSAATAFEISTPDQLWEVTDCLIPGTPVHFKLTQDIDVQDAVHATTASPIGSSSATIYSFSGVILGADYEVSNISMSSTTHGVGLFAELHDATVTRLAISGAVSTSAASGVRNSAGGLAIFSDGNTVLDAISSSFSVTGGAWVGGLIGHANGSLSIDRSAFDGTIQGKRYVGGLVGELENGQVERSTISGQITQSGANTNGEAGGLVGYSSDSVTLSYVANFASISGEKYVAGLLGLASSGGTPGLQAIYIENSINHSTVSATAMAAGLIAAGGSTQLTVVSSSNLGRVASTYEAGGLTAGDPGFLSIIDSSNYGAIAGSGGPAAGLAVYASNATISGSVNRGVVSSSGILSAGLISQAFTSLDVIDSKNIGEVKGTNDVGGLVGKAVRLTVVRSTNSATVSGGSRVGGIVGTADRGLSLSESENQGTVLASGSETGGLVGHIANSGVSGGIPVISQSSNAGNVTGQSANVGGLVGISLTNLSASANANLGDISGGDYVGGIVGQVFLKFWGTNLRNEGSVLGADWNIGGIGGYLVDDAELARVENRGSVTSGPTGDRVGGLVGYGDEDVTISYSRNVGQVSGSDNVGGLVGRADNLSIHQAYNAGEVLSPGVKDGLVAVGTLPFTQSTLTTVTSRFQSAVAIDTLKTEAPFTGWDFTVWGFGQCSEFDGLLLIRDLGQVGAYYSEGCFTPPVLSTPEVTPAPTYSGPMLDPVVAQVIPGSSLLLTGSRLQSVYKVEFAGLTHRIVSATADSIEIVVHPETKPGQFDLVLHSSFGSLTVQGALRVGFQPAVVEEQISASDLVGKTKVMSRNLTVQNTWLLENLTDSGLTRVVCTVAVSEMATRHQRVLARRQARDLCDRVSGYLGSASTWFQTKSTSNSRFAGRLMLTFKG